MRILPLASYLARSGILDSYLLYFSCFGYVREVPIYLKHYHRTIILDFNRFARKSAKLAVRVNSNSTIPLFSWFLLAALQSKHVCSQIFIGCLRSWRIIGTIDLLHRPSISPKLHL